ncbi:Murein L,D-transpeptidase YcbB/YkuD [Cohaesibacter gelatinilyticus]|uniref:Murein L,D-transpeptidase YcbB/YkuD n=2 Tax=Cohaesibacter gelatinilyticus TaxID=372072 RepID=A0A285NCU9_9HYPH|nr:Murein L,D-transpeptidase YcbB/YkuD [Cohaesibacter gelatinilyticus]
MQDKKSQKRHLPANASNPTERARMLEMSRRQVFGLGTGLAASLVMAKTVPAFAQSNPLDEVLNQNQVEWGDRFDTPGQTVAAVRTAEPTLSPQTASNIEQAMQFYYGVVQRGGWPLVPDTKILRIGARSEAVTILRQRLTMSGDLQQSLGVSDVFDSYVDAAIRRFQSRHGISPDGLVGKETFAALNVPAQVRLRQLETNLVRVRAMSGYLGDRYVMVNIPAAEIETVQTGAVHSRHTAVVGKIDRQSPVLASKIHEINFNPYWHVPLSIIRKDLIPKMQKDPDYLKDNRIHIRDLRNNVELDASQVDWTTDEALNYQFRQEPGAKNSMGSIKINFHNKHAVYLHDTPSKTLFGSSYRFHSSGCVRVQNVREFVTWVLGQTPGWNRLAIDDVIRSGERMDVSVRSRVPIYMTYITAWATSGGMIHFRDDIYNRDGLSPVAPLQ